MYDGTGFHVDNRKSKHDTIIQKQSCSKFAPFNKMALFAKVFLQFPAAHDQFNIQMRIRITGEAYETVNKAGDLYCLNLCRSTFLGIGENFKGPFEIPYKYRISSTFHQEASTMLNGLKLV